MLKTLKIQNFKSLKNLQIENLGRLNLIVGKNNSGKSTVLESIRILASNGYQPVIDEIVDSHDDNIFVQNNMNSEGISVYEGLFFDRAFPADNEPIYIGSLNRKNYVELRRVFYRDTIEEKLERGSLIRSRKRTFFKNELDINDDDDFVQAIQVTTHRSNDRPSYLEYRDSSYRHDISYRHDSRSEKIKFSSPISYIPTQFLSMDLLASLWDNAVLTPYFENVRKFLKIISEDFEDLAFIKVNTKDRYGIERDMRRTGIIKLKNKQKPIPLNSMGDGVLRILQLVLGMFPAKGGYLLIDEFENGLHYSVQEKIWELLFDLAKSMDIQVFVTTHSWDCIESFSKASTENRKIEASLFRLGRSMMLDNRGEVIATVYDKNKLLNLTQSDVELR